MRKQGKRNPNPENAVRGPVVETRRVQDASTEGNTEWTERQMVQHGSEPLDGVFGLLKSEIQNERNTNKSFREDVYVDVDDLHTLPAQEHKGLDELGGENVVVSKSLVDITTAMPAEERGNLIVNDKVVAKDRFHAAKEKVTVEAWEPRTIVTKGDADAGGVDSTVTKQVVAGATAWPTPTANTMLLRREQIGYDKYLQTQKDSNTTQGTMSSRNALGVLSCETLTEEKKVPLSFTFPAKTIDTVAQTLKQLDGFNALYSRTTLVDGWPTLVSYEEESTTGMKVTITRTVHGTDPGLTSGVARTVGDVDHTGCDRWTKTVRVIHADILTTTFTEYHTVEYFFPAYLDPTTPFTMSPGIKANKSGSFSLKVPCKFETTYLSAPPAPAEIFQFIPISLDVNIYASGTGGEYRLRIPNVICNSGTFTAYSGIIDFTIPASKPTSTELASYMSSRTELLIAEDTTKWKYNLWKRTKVWLKMPDRRLTLV